MTINTPKTSCAECVNFIPPEETKFKLGTSFGDTIPGCLAKAIPLHTYRETPGQQKAAFHFQSQNCTDYNVPQEKKTNRERGSSEVLFLQGTNSSLQYPDAHTFENSCRPNSCRECVYFKDEYDVRNAFAMEFNFCMAKGEILLEKNFERDAQDCPTALYRWGTDGKDIRQQAAQNVSSEGDFYYIPEVEDFTLAPTYLKAKEYNPKVAPALTDLVPIPDPRETVLKDPNVHTEELRAKTGVIGYQVVTNHLRPEIRDKKTGEMVPNVIAFDVFDREWEGFTALERSKIPTTDQLVDLFHDPDDELLWFVMDAWNGTDQVPFLQGGPGIGKTQAITYAAWRMQLPLHDFSCNPETTRDNYIGLTGVVNDEGVPITKFQAQGPAAFYDRPGVILLDEYNLLPSEMATSMRSFLDGKNINPEEDPDHTIIRHDYCFPACTGNYWFDAGSHNVNPLADPEKSRVKGKHVDRLPEKIEREITILACKSRQDYVISQATLDAIFKLVQDIRNGIEERTLPGVFSLRQIINLALSTERNTLSQAVNSVFSVDLEPKHRRLLESLISIGQEVVEADDSAIFFQKYQAV